MAQRTQLETLVVNMGEKARNCYILSMRYDFKSSKTGFLLWPKNWLWCILKKRVPELFSAITVSLD